MHLRRNSTAPLHSKHWGRGSTTHIRPVPSSISIIKLSRNLWKCKRAPTTFTRWRWRSSFKKMFTFTHSWMNHFRRYWNKCFLYLHYKLICRVISFHQWMDRPSLLLEVSCVTFSNHEREVHCQQMEACYHNLLLEMVLTGNAYESDCFLPTGNDGKSGVFFRFGQTHGC